MTPESPSPVVQFVTSSAFQKLQGTEDNLWAHFFPFFFCFKEIKDTQKKGRVVGWSPEVSFLSCLWLILLKCCMCVGGVWGI